MSSTWSVTGSLILLGLAWGSFADAPEAPQQNRPERGAGDMSASGKPSSRKRRRRRKPLELRQVRAVLSEAIEMLEFYIVLPAEEGKRVDPADLCKLTHALSQAANTYRSIVETEVLAGRIDELEAQLADMAEGSPRHAEG